MYGYGRIPDRAAERLRSRIRFKFPLSDDRGPAAAAAQGWQTPGDFSASSPPGLAASLTMDPASTQFFAKSCRIREVRPLI